MTNRSGAGGGALEFLDEIRIQGLRFMARHGALAWEAHKSQPFHVDVRVGACLEAAARSDKLRDTLDYGRLYDMVADVVLGPRRRLLESLAGAIAEKVLQDVRVQWVEVVVHKPLAPIAGQPDDVAVAVRRTR